MKAMRRYESWAGSGGSGGEQVWCYVILRFSGGAFLKGEVDKQVCS